MHQELTVINITAGLYAYAYRSGSAEGTPLTVRYTRAEAAEAAKRGTPPAGADPDQWYRYETDRILREPAHAFPSLLKLVTQAETTFAGSRITYEYEASHLAFALMADQATVDYLETENPEAYDYIRRCRKKEKKKEQQNPKGMTPLEAALERYRLDGDREGLRRRLRSLPAEELADWLTDNYEIK